MIVEVEESFKKDFQKLKNKELQNRIIQKIQEIESQKSIQESANVKKMKGFQNFYRVRIGDYRIGFELKNIDTLILLRVSHRKDIYHIFP